MSRKNLLFANSSYPIIGLSIEDNSSSDGVAFLSGVSEKASTLPPIILTSLLLVGHLNIFKTSLISASGFFREHVATETKSIGVLLPTTTSK